MRWLQSTLPCAVLVSTLMLVGCGSDTAILLEFDSDTLTAPEDVDRLELEVEGTESGKRLERKLRLDADFPHTFSVLPAGLENEQVRITVTGRKGMDPDDEQGVFVVQRVVQASFRPGTESLLGITLFGECEGIECAAGIDCVAGSCTKSTDPDEEEPTEAAPGCTEDAECDDGNPCNGMEVCEAEICVSPGTPDCDDGIACTVDTCADGACIHTPDDTMCVEGDTCSLGQGCGGRPCSGDADCDDGMVCNGMEFCDGDTCRTEAPPDCDDGVTCTRDACDEEVGGCVNEPDDLVCDDGLFCNGTETCDPAMGCTQGPAPDCDDGDPCTDEVCSPMMGACHYTTRDVDLDGHGDAACAAVGGIPADDCDDLKGSIHPGSPEMCDEVDQDCDGETDEGCDAGCDTSCPDATAVTGTGGRFTASMGGSEHTGSCGGAGAETVYSFTTTVTSDVFVSTHGAGVDTVVYLRSCTCAGDELGCNDDADGLASSALQLSNLAPGTYSVFVDTKEAMSVPVDVDIYVTPSSGPADHCGRVMPLGDMRTGNTCGDASDLDGACNMGQSFKGPDHVYYFVVSGESREVTLDTCTGCTRIDSTLDLRSVCTPGGSGRVACAEDGCRSSCVGGPKRHATITRTLSPGLYYVWVDAKDEDCGDYTLTATGL